MLSEYREQFLSFLSRDRIPESEYVNKRLLIILKREKNEEKTQKYESHFYRLYCDVEKNPEFFQKKRLIQDYASPQMFLYLDPDSPEHVFSTDCVIMREHFQFLFYSESSKLTVAIGRPHDEICSQSCHQNLLKKINFNFENVKMVLPQWRMKKITPAYLWKFALYYPHQTSLIVQNIIVAHPPNQAYAVSAFLDATTRLGFHPNHKIKQKQYKIDTYISTIIRKEKRIYLKRRIFLIEEITIVSETEFFITYDDNSERGIFFVSDLDETHIRDLYLIFLKKIFSRNNVSTFHQFIRQFIKSDVCIIANILSDVDINQSCVNRYVCLYFPRSPQKVGEVYDPLNWTSKVKIYQLFHNLMSRVLKYGVMEYIKHRLSVDIINTDFHPGCPILSLYRSKKPVFKKDDLLSCRIDYETYDLLHRRAFEIYAESNETVYPVSIGMANLYFFIKMHHEKLKEDPAFSEYSDLFKKRIIKRSILEIPSQINFFTHEKSKHHFICNLGTVILTSWEGASKYVYDNQNNANNIMRISLYQLNDIMLDLREPGKSLVYARLQNFGTNVVYVGIKDNIDLEYDPAFQKDQFVVFFKAIVKAYNWIKDHPERTLLIHCRSGIGRGAIFTAILWYYAIGLESVNLPQHPNLEVSQKCQLREKFARSVFKSMLSQRIFINLHKRYLPFINYTIEQIFDHLFYRSLTPPPEFDKFDPDIGAKHLSFWSRAETVPCSSSGH